MVKRQPLLTSKGTEKTSTRTLEVKAVRRATPEDFTIIRIVQEKQAQRVERFHAEDRPKMRNRINEKEQQLKILLDLVTELEIRALKTKRNPEHEILLKCAELIQDYASELVKEIINEK